MQIEFHQESQSNFPGIALPWVLFVFSTVGRQVFTSFLRSEFSEENMDFWVACEEYKKMVASELAARAQQIYQQYIQADAPKEVIQLVKTRKFQWEYFKLWQNWSFITPMAQFLFFWVLSNLKIKSSKWFFSSQPLKIKVNLDAVIREKTKQNVNSPCPSTFDEAQKMIYTLMEKDSYRRFLCSTLVQDLLQTQTASARVKKEKKSSECAENRHMLAGGA